MLQPNSAPSREHTSHFAKFGILPRLHKEAFFSALEKTTSMNSLEARAMDLSLEGSMYVRGNSNKDKAKLMTCNLIYDGPIN
jgi:hypothetical protein